MAHKSLILSPNKDGTFSAISVKHHEDKKYHFSDYFDPKTGVYFCSDVSEGPEEGKDPFMRSFPALIDIGIMGHCIHGRSGLCAASGIQCYQSGLKKHVPNMSLEDYERIMEEAEQEDCFQVALGGRGDPDMHEQFEEVLRTTRAHGIVPNFTTSGLGMTPEKAALCKKYCGAVAVSMYSRLKDTIPELAIRRTKEKHNYNTEADIPVRFTFGGIDPSCCFDAPNYVIDGERWEWDELHHMVYGTDFPYDVIRIFNERIDEKNYTMQAIKMLIDAGVQTNIHYVLSKSTIDEAIIRLKYNGFPSGVNAVVFLLHKPVGQGQQDEVLDIHDPKVLEFFELVDHYHGPFKIGFDSCTIPAVINLCSSIDGRSMDSCEGGRFSMYITSDLKALPCSFDNEQERWAFDLHNHTIMDAWNSPAFEAFRSHHRNSCPDCPNQSACRGGCPICPEIVLCDKKK